MLFFAFLSFVAMPVLSSMKRGERAVMTVGRYGTKREPSPRCGVAAGPVTQDDRVQPRDARAASRSLLGALVAAVDDAATAYGEPVAFSELVRTCPRALRLLPELTGAGGRLHQRRGSAATADTSPSSSTETTSRRSPAPVRMNRRAKSQRRRTMIACTAVRVSIE
jgi:hypothetical protein